MASSALIKVADLVILDGVFRSNTVPIPDDAAELFIFVPADITFGNLIINYVDAEVGTTMNNVNQGITGDSGYMVADNMYVVEIAGKVMAFQCANVTGDKVVSIWKRALVG